MLSFFLLLLIAVVQVNAMTPDDYKHVYYEKVNYTDYAFHYTGTTSVRLSSPLSDS